MGPTNRILILQHEQAGSAGSLGAWARARGFELEVLMAREQWAVPDLDSFQFVASLGSPDASYDDSLDWLPRELELLRRAHATGLPVFGICFGSQSLARALGAGTELCEAREIGWLEMDSRRPQLLAPGPWLFWHEDRFEVPPGAELLASTPVGPAAFLAGRSLGVQFHPEAEPDAVEEWMQILEDQLTPRHRDELRRGFADPDRVRERAWQLYDAFLEVVVRGR